MTKTEILNVKKFLHYMELEIIEMQLQQLEAQDAHDFLQVREIQTKIDMREKWKVEKMGQLTDYLEDVAIGNLPERTAGIRLAFEVLRQFQN